MQICIKCKMEGMPVCGHDDCVSCEDCCRCTDGFLLVDSYEEPDVAYEYYKDMKAYDE